MGSVLLILFTLIILQFTYIFPLRSRLNSLPVDPAAAAMPVADAAENEANDPEDSAFNPGVPELVDPCPDEL